MSSETVNECEEGGGAANGAPRDGADGGADRAPALVAAVPSSDGGERLDAVAARLFPMHSRNRLQGWIAAGLLTVDARSARTRERLVGGETLRLRVPDGALAASGSDGAGEASWQRAEAEALPLPLAHEDAAILVVDKPAGLVMHPAPGNLRGTLVNALLHHDAALREVPRAGVVHRLDKDTSGLCVVARTLVAHTHLVRQLQSREMGREYLAVVLGDPPGKETIEAPIARHPKDRKRMAVVGGGRHAVTHYRVLERFVGCALVAVRLETGRTHQIRVHMTHVGLPLIGDPVYGRRRTATLPAALAGEPLVAGFARQALHAARLTLVHPDDESTRTFESPPPADLAALLAALRRASGESSGGGRTVGWAAGRRYERWAGRIEWRGGGVNDPDSREPLPSSAPTGTRRTTCGCCPPRGRAASASRRTTR